jgi:hypothetical protein
LMALQSTVASLDQYQSPPDLKKALDKIETHYNNWLEAVGSARRKPGPVDTNAGVPGVKVGSGTDLGGGFRVK